jgi:hypothetical protein
MRYKPAWASSVMISSSAECTGLRRVITRMAQMIAIADRK